MFTPYEFGQLPAAPDVWFQQLNPSAEYADFSYDATALVGGDPLDSITGLSFAALPSGVGEVVPSRLQLFAPYLVSVWLTGGVPGRTYLYQLQITTALIRVYTVFIGQVANPLLAACPVPPPPNPGFGTPIVWP